MSSYGQPFEKGKLPRMEPGIRVEVVDQSGVVAPDTETRNYQVRQDNPETGFVILTVDGLLAGNFHRSFVRPWGVAKLPSYFENNVRIQFHDENDLQEQREAIRAQSQREKQVQSKLRKYDSTDYPSADTVVLVGEGDDFRADGVTSWGHGGMSDAPHRPVLDLDFPAALIPSSTEGHFHLYIDKEMPWEDYAKLLTVMGEVGLLEEGYVEASLDQGYSSARLPWVRK